MVNDSYLNTFFEFGKSVAYGRIGGSYDEGKDNEDEQQMAQWPKAAILPQYHGSIPSGCSMLRV